MSILDSGKRREFVTGAVRDIEEGKGRCDLLPLDVVTMLWDSDELKYIEMYKQSGDPLHLVAAIRVFSHNKYVERSTMLLELSKHFEDGALKYGEYNWQKGIPTHCYIDSAIRHYLKYIRGDEDENHDRAFLWNLVCCIWTCGHLPEWNDYAREKNENVVSSY